MEFDVSPVVVGMVVSFIAFAIFAGVAAYAMPKACNHGHEGWVVLTVAACLTTVVMFITWMFFLQKIASSYL